MHAPPVSASQLFPILPAHLKRYVPVYNEGKQYRPPRRSQRQQPLPRSTPPPGYNFDAGRDHTNVAHTVELDSGPSRYRGGPSGGAMMGREKGLGSGKADSGELLEGEKTDKSEQMVNWDKCTNASKASISTAATRSPRLPFFRDPLHRIPTIHLYRSLRRKLGHLDDGIRGETTANLTPHIDQRQSSSSSIITSYRARLSHTWRKHRHLTSIPRARDFLLSQHALLDALSPPTSNPLSPTSPSNTPSLSASLLSLLPPPIPTPKPRPARVEPRPRLTGGFMRATLHNPPLPRLKPQPVRLGMMIHERIIARDRRAERRKELVEMNRDMALELAFWRRLGPGACAVDQVDVDVGVEDGPRSKTKTHSNTTTTRNSHFRPAGKLGVWDDDTDTPMKDAIQLIDVAFRRETQRSKMVFDEHLEGRIWRAKARKEARQRQRAEDRKSAKVGEGEIKL